MATIPIATVRADLALMVSGRFTPDTVGPAAYDAAVARARSEPSRYLKAFTAGYLGGELDGFRLARLRPSMALKIIQPADPEAVRGVAARMLGHLDALLVVFDSALDMARLTELLPEKTRDMHRLLDRERQRLRRIIEAEESGR